MTKIPQTDKPASAATGPDLDQLSTTSQKSMLALGHLNSRLLRNAFEVNAQLLDFAQNRIGEDIRTSERLACCDNVADTVEVISGFYQKAFAEYAEEATQLVKLGSDAATHSLEDIQRGAMAVSEPAVDK